LPHRPFVALRSTRLRAIVALLVVAGAAAPALARDDHENDDEGYSIGLWGDLPYSTVQETTGLPNLIADMNAQRLKFSVHNGDLKQGSGSLCDDNLYYRALGWFDSLQAPAMFTPGDNDWTDCDRAANGGFNSRERLDRERAIFFASWHSMGQRRMRQEVQTEALCLGVNGAVPCVENRRWSVDGVTYVTLNVPGSCNNLCDTLPDPAEFAARNAANIKWLKDSFAVAKARRSRAVMVIAQANPGWDGADASRASLRDPRTLAQTDALPDGYKDYLVALRDEVTAFRRPVAYVHGDSHYFRVDKPLLDALGRRLENFTRVETFGNNAANANNDVQWLRVKVEPRTREVFSYQPMIVPGNREAVPVP
jgi:hypothetical protein